MQARPDEAALVTVVDEGGSPVAVAAKLDAHRPPGRLHLAISVFLYDDGGRLLLQQRAAHKYHFPLVWANACCSHPAPDEDPLAAAHRRLGEELGVRCLLVPAGVFTYRAACGRSGLIEHEYDHVFIGRSTAPLTPDPAEVASLAWVEPDALLGAVRSGGRGGEPDLARHGGLGLSSGPAELAPWLLPALRLAEATRRSGA